MPAIDDGRAIRIYGQSGDTAGRPEVIIGTSRPDADMTSSDKIVVFVTNADGKESVKASIDKDGNYVGPTGTVSGSNTGDVTLATVGSTPANAGASLSGQVLTLQPADATHGGVISTAAQTIPGAKTFPSVITSTAADNVIAIQLTSGAQISFETGGGILLRRSGSGTITLGGSFTALGDVVVGSGGSGDLSFLRNISATNFTNNGATTGDMTVNTNCGINAFAGAATAITITNSNVAATSTVLAVLQTADATAVLKNVVPASGSFTITLSAAATGTTKVAWWVINH